MQPDGQLEIVMQPTCEEFHDECASSEARDLYAMYRKSADIFVRCRSQNRPRCEVVGLRAL